MKLQNEFDFVKGQFAKNAEKIRDYASKLKASGNYQDFEKRLTFDCLRAFVGVATMCDWYEKYNCNDSHIYTVGRKALKELEII